MVKYQNPHAIKSIDISSPYLEDPEQQKNALVRREMDVNAQKSLIVEATGEAVIIINGSDGSVRYVHTHIRQKTRIRRRNDGDIDDKRLRHNSSCPFIPFLFADFQTRDTTRYQEANTEFHRYAFNCMQTFKITTWLRLNSARL